MNAECGKPAKSTTNAHQHSRMGRDGISEVQRARRQFVFIRVHSWFPVRSSAKRKLICAPQPAETPTMEVSIV